MPHCVLSLFGPGALRERNGALIPLPKLGFLLAGYLLLTAFDEFLPRPELAAFLWPFVEPQVAASNLRQLIRRIKLVQDKHHLQLFVITTQGIKLNFHDAKIDIVEFEQAFLLPTEQRISTLCRIFSDNFLKSSMEKGEAGFIWWHETATRFRHRFLDQIIPWLSNKSNLNDIPLAELAAQRLLHFEPYEELGHRTLMILAAAQGNSERVAQIFRKLKYALDKNLGGKPSQETLNVMRQLMKPSVPKPISDGKARANTSARLLPPLDQSTPVLDGQTGPFASGLLPNDAKKAIVILTIQSEIGSRADHFNLRMLGLNLSSQVAKLAKVVVVHSAMVANHLKKISGRDAQYVLSLEHRRIDGRPKIEMKLFSLQIRELLSIRTFDNVGLFAAEVESSVYRLAYLIEQNRANLALQNPAEFEVNRICHEAQQDLARLDLPLLRRARKKFSSALKIDASHLESLAGLSRSYVFEFILLSNGEPSPLQFAQTISQKAIDLEPENFIGHRELGIAQMYLKDWDNHIGSIETAYNIAPDSADMMIDLADSRVTQGRLKDAIDLFDKIDSRADGFEDLKLWNRAGAEYLAGNYQIAINNIMKMQNQMGGFTHRRCVFCDAG